MATSYSNTYKNEKRNQSKVLKRQALFISEYVQTKYEGIYTEAASMYNKINKEHPRKPDLRKTLEFRLWKSNVARGNGEPPIHIPREKKYTCKRTTYRDIALKDTETPPETPSQQKQTSSYTNDKIMCLNIPLIEMPNKNASQEYLVEEGDQTADPSVEHTFDQALDPSLLDQIAPETIEKIIRELQQDPNLNELMDDVVNNMDIEEELVGLELDLPEPDERLQEELELW